MEAPLQMCPEVCSLSDYKPTHIYSEDELPQWPNASVWNDKKHVCLGLVGTAQSFVSGKLDFPFMFHYRIAHLESFIEFWLLKLFV